MTERKHQHRESRKARLEYAGFEFIQTQGGRWAVMLPNTKSIDETIERNGDPYRKLPKTYKHLTVAVSAGIREIERKKAMRDAGYELNEEWKDVLARYDGYPQETE